ncbi:MAG: YraN family protein [Bifidobacteriaceae bacterium]|jgi:putative endonuclease|nr:YraN family protein [Bifidobacteriaceae bacterium]
MTTPLRNTSGTTRDHTHCDENTIADLTPVLCNPTLNRAEFGRVGEIFAAATLRASGLTVIDCNYHTRYGEIDLVCRESDTIVFVEVKARRTTRFGQPAEAVTFRKQQRVHRAAYEWLTHYGHKYGAHGTRFDVVSLLVNGTHITSSHLTAAF